MAKSESYVDVHMLFCRYSKRMSENKRRLKLQEVLLCDATSFNYSCMKTRFQDTPKGRVLCARYNWYIKRIQEYATANPRKILRITHWDMRCGNPEMFTFGGVIYPDIAYSSNSGTEQWFCARNEVDYNTVIIQSGSRCIPKESPIKIFLENQLSKTSNDENSFPLASCLSARGQSHSRALATIPEIRREDLYARGDQCLTCDDQNFLWKGMKRHSSPELNSPPPIELGIRQKSVKCKTQLGSFKKSFVKYFDVSIKPSVSRIFSPKPKRSKKNDKLSECNQLLCLSRQTSVESLLDTDGFEPEKTFQDKRQNEKPRSPKEFYTKCQKLGRKLFKP